MELRQLEYFAAVARHRHFTRAAEALYVTQPALSQQIRRLEAELGLALFRRTSRGVELTAAGEDLLVHAEKMLAEVAQTRADMDRHTGVSRGVVRVAATAADAPRLPDALADFHHDHPHIQIALRQGSAAELVALVQRGAVDVAVLALTDAPAGRGRARRWRTSRCAPRCPSTTSWPAPPSSSISCAAAPFILAEPGTALRDTVMHATQAAGFSPLPLFEVGDPATVRFLVRAGLGIALVPASWLERPGPVVGAADLTTHRATGCRCSRPRRAPHRPAGCCSSACSSSSSRRLRGRAPTSVWIGVPLWNSMKVGIQSTPYRTAMLLLVVDVDADDLQVVAVGRDLVEDRAHDATGRAPGGGEVDEHGLARTRGPRR